MNSGLRECLLRSLDKDVKTERDLELYRKFVSRVYENDLVNKSEYASLGKLANIREQEIREAFKNDNGR